jgi:hypothetical protein
MIWTICLIFADIQKANALLTVDDKNGRASDIERRQSQSVIDAVMLDHRAIYIDQDWYVEAMGLMVLGYFCAALANDHHDLGF